MIQFNHVHINQSKMGEPLRADGSTPDKADWRKIKSVSVADYPDSPEHPGQD